MIPARAVEAAAKAIQDGAIKALSNPSVDGVYDGMPYWEHIAQVALEAAAPHMLAQAWQEGYLYSYDQERGGNGALPIPVPEYLADDLVQWNPYMLNNEGGEAA